QYTGQPALQIFEIDITEQRLSEKTLQKRTMELERSNKALEQFAYATSHDLQEPLRTIASFLQLLKRKYEDSLDSEAHQFINFAVDGAIHMKQLIDDLLFYSRLGRKDISFKPVSLSQIIEKSINNLRVVIEENKAQVISKKLPVIRVDESQFILLFQNLIENAIKFRDKEKPVIEITAKVSKGNHIISVKDNGIGIEKKYHNRIFQVFKRLHTSSEYPGTGIGLAICKRVIEQYHGKIWVESELGKGATFAIEFPII
ncbi:MAG: GHKL domain-containing protein, partial [Candidatus Heimdallarchaeota archaeon]|nr:GHKL domain-containing protein [Candidatus Heimdallarchaeota archaeon]